MIPEYQIKKPSKIARKFLAITAFFIIIFGAGFAVYAYAKIHRPVSSFSQPVTFSVPKGATTRDVGSQLKEKDLITSNLLFTGYSLVQGANGKIQAGDYQLDKKMTMDEILNTLISGKVTRSVKRVTIVEGATNIQIKKILIDQGLVTSNQFDDAVSEDFDFDFNPEAREYKYEGYLFPDTYQFDVTWDAEQIIQRMLQNFDVRFTEQMRADIKSKNLNTSEVVVLASIIEREVGRSSAVQITEEVTEVMQREREQVASVFYNRLKIDMALQSDATVNYVTGKNDRQARFDDLEVESPYNTYANTGLPPGPISNPGINSILAAIYPAQTDFLYFLSDISGTAYFGRTLEDHNSNRAKYLD